MPQTIEMQNNMKLKLIELKGEINKSTIIDENFNISQQSLNSARIY
jgi:hypothetical protein